MTETHIRRAVASDAAAMAAMWWKLIELETDLDPEFYATKGKDDCQKRMTENFQRAVTLDDFCVVVAEQKGGLVGYAYGSLRETRPIFVHGKTFVVGSLFVEPEWRRRGMCRRMFRELEEFARHSGAVLIQVEDITRGNRPALDTYSCLGFRAKSENMLKWLK